MTTTMTIIGIYAIGYVLAFLWCKSQKKTTFDSLVISCASWLLLALYLIHFLYNYFNKEEE